MFTNLAIERGPHIVQWNTGPKKSWGSALGIATRPSIKSRHPEVATVEARQMPWGFILEMVHAPWIFLAMVSFFSGHVETCDFEFCRNHWFTMETADRRKHLSDKDRVGTQLKNNSADILIIWDAPLTYLNSQKYTSCSSPQTCECAIWVSGSFGLSMHFLLLAGDQT
jgi:hypothetical protein